MHVKKLKGLRDVTITFKEDGLTAIMGPNGNGKSTILHALACIYQGVGTHQFKEFFTPTTNNTWTDSEFSIEMSVLDGSSVKKETKSYKKGTDRWTRYSSLFNRTVYFIGVSTGVPDIEKEKSHTQKSFSKTVLSDDTSKKVLDIVGKIMNREYSEYSELSSKNKSYIGVSYNTISYSSLSMGAGEKRLFEIIEQIYKAPKYSLILIDEIDILIHQDALCRLLEQLKTMALSNNLQIIFTTHNQFVANHPQVEIRHIHQTDDKTWCFSDTKPDAIKRLTGMQVKPISIYVEDELAKTIVKKICPLAIPYISIIPVGCWQSCISAACGYILMNTPMNVSNNVLFVLDGDIKECRDEEGLKKQIQLHATGSDENSIAVRSKAFSIISQFVIPNLDQPEKFINNCIINMPSETLSEEEKMIISIAKEIKNPIDKHQYIDDIVSNGIDLCDIVNLFAKTEQWEAYVAPIKNWINERHQTIVEQ